MKPIVQKVLESGLVDAATARMMEHFKMLPEGAAALAADNENKLEQAVETDLKKLSEELAIEVERERTLRETHLDLERIRWPAMVDVLAHDSHQCLAYQVPAVMDRFGRYYFRPDDVSERALTPGNRFRKMIQDPEVPGALKSSYLLIIEVTPLFIGEQKACLQITVAAQP